MVKLMVLSNEIIIKRNKYLKDPCGACAIPFWKEIKLKLPENMKVIHEKYFEDSDLEEYRDTTYFRLIHHLKKIEAVELKSDYEVKTVEISSEVDDIVHIINNSYEDIKVNKIQVEGWSKESVYDEKLWVFILDKLSKKPIALGIADFDQEMKEGSLEWIQVLPDYRGQGIGQVLVNELLIRLREKAAFVTVSGQSDNETKPEKLYRKCGFEGNDIWHVMRKK